MKDDTLAKAFYIIIGTGVIIAAAAILVPWVIDIVRDAATTPSF